MTNLIEFLTRIWDVVSDTALTTIMSVPFIVFAAVCGVVALVLWIKDQAAKARARREARRVNRIHSIRNHPAGRAMNQPRVLEATRHLDRAGTDWTSGIVPD